MVRASAVDLFGFGARGSAMGGAVATTSTGFEAVYYNPASLTLASDLSFNIGIQGAHFDLHLNQQKLDVRDAPALTIGFGLPIPFGGWLEKRLTLGFGFVIPQSSVLIADIPRPGEPGFTLLETRAQAVAIQAALGVHITDWLAFGFGMLALGELDGGVNVAPKDDGSLGSTVKSELVATYSYTGGILLKPAGWFRAAFTLRSSSYARFVYPMEVSLGEDFPLPIPPLHIEGLAQYDPFQMSVECSFQLTSRWLLALGVVMKAWSAFPNVVEYTATQPDTAPQPEPNFNDTLVTRLGTEGRFEWGDTVLTPRAGLVYEPTPAPDATGFHSYLDNDRVIASFGLGFEWSFLQIGVSGQWHHLLGRSVTKTAEGAEPAVLDHGGNMFFWLIETGVRL
jgi:long-chain fatty acid transport protein